MGTTEQRRQIELEVRRCSPIPTPKPKRRKAVRAWGFINENGVLEASTEWSKDLVKELVYKTDRKLVLVEIREIP